MNELQQQESIELLQKTKKFVVAILVITSENYTDPTSELHMKQNAEDMVEEAQQLIDRIDRLLGDIVDQHHAYPLSS